MKFAPRSAILYTGVACLLVSGIKPEAVVFVASTRAMDERSGEFHRKRSMMFYSLSSDDVVVDVGGAWDDFALANDGEDCTREHVVGNSIFNFISGPEVVTLYQALFSSVRKQQRPLSFAFRCDAPARLRRMMLYISPLPEHGLVVTTELLRESSRDLVSLLERDAERSEEQLDICCICSKVRSDRDEWVPIEEESARRNLLERLAIPRLSHGYCPPCLEEQLALSVVGP